MSPPPSLDQTSVCCAWSDARAELAEEPVLLRVAEEAVTERERERQTVGGRSERRLGLGWRAGWRSKRGRDGFITYSLPDIGHASPLLLVSPPRLSLAESSRHQGVFRVPPSE
jgi:hypothetical protein